MGSSESDDTSHVLKGPSFIEAQRSSKPAAGRVADEHYTATTKRCWPSDTLLARCNCFLHSCTSYFKIPLECWAVRLGVTPPEVHIPNPTEYL